MRNRGIYIAVGVLVLLTASWFVYKYFAVQSSQMNNAASEGKSPAQGGGAARGGAERALPVSVYIADYENIVEGSVSTGVLSANEEVDVSTAASGFVEKISFEEGQFVKQGQLLLKIDDRDFQAQLKRAEHQFSLASEKLERQRILFEKDAVSREAFDQAQTDCNLIAADIELLKVRIDRTEIKAPFSGVIGFRAISLGSYLQVGAKIARLVDMATLKLDISIPEKLAAQSLIGALARFTVQGSEKEFTARVYAVEPTLDAVTKTMLVRARYDNREGFLRPGMSPRVSLSPERPTSALLVPSEAVVPDVAGRTVWLVRSGKAVQVPVKTGNRTQDKVEIMDGIVQGDSVITSGLLQVRQGLPVKATTF